jgi:hypothetical protein
MFNIKDSWQVWRINRKINSIRELYKEAIRKAEGKSKEDLIAERIFEIETLEHERHHIFLDRWVKLAENYDVPVPPDSDEELTEQCGLYEPNTRHLSEQGLKQVIGFVKKERKKNIRAYAAWIAVIVGLCLALMLVLKIWAMFSRR